MLFLFQKFYDNHQTGPRHVHITTKKILTLEKVLCKIPNSASRIEKSISKAVITNPFGQKIEVSIEKGRKECFLFTLNSL